MQRHLENIRLVVKQNKVLFNKTYSGLVSDSLKSQNDIFRFKRETRQIRFHKVYTK